MKVPPLAYILLHMNDEIIDRLRAFLKDDQILTADEDLDVYSFDGTAMLRQRPQCVVLPETAEEVSQVLALANAKKVPVVTRGSGTGLAGGSVPVDGCIVLCLVRLNRIVELDAKNLVMVVEPGVLTQDIADAGSAAGSIYPPDLWSLKISMVGGNLSNNPGAVGGW